jgi:hypothetical protein
MNKYNVKDQHHIRYIQWKWDNYQYVRVYLPKNAIVIEKPWYTVEQFDRYKIVGFFIKTRLYETTTHELNYSINKPNCNWYSYKLYKQPGIKKYDMNLNFNWESISAKNVQKDFIINR